MIKVYGASDDLIEIEGDIREEFSGDRGYLGFSNGTVIHIYYTSKGIWRISPFFGNSVIYQVNRETDEYSDTAHIYDDIKWVIYGTDLAAG